MFDQLKNIYNLRKQASELQKQLAQEKFSGSSRDGIITIVINGNQEILEVQIDDSQGLDKSRLANGFKEAFAKAHSEMKTALSKKFAGMM